MVRASATSKPCFDTPADQAIQYAGYDSKLDINFDAHGYGGTVGIHVEDVYGVADDVVDQHAACVRIYESYCGPAHLVSDQECGFIMSQAGGSNLPQRARIMSHVDMAFVDTGCTILASYCFCA